MLRLKFVAISVTTGDAEQERGDAKPAINRTRGGAGGLRRSEPEIVLVERLLEAVGVEFCSHAEGVPVMGFAEVSTPLINVGDNRRAGTFFWGGTIICKSAIGETNRIEVALARPKSISAREALIVSAGLNQFLREIFRQQNRIGGEAIVSTELH